MKRFVKFTAWICLLACIAALVFAATAESNGQLSVTINGQRLEGAPKLFAGTLGFLVAGFTLLFAFGVAAFAVAGSALLVFVVLAIVGIILIALAAPFLLPVAIPIALIACFVLFRRQTRRTPIASACSGQKAFPTSTNL